MSFNILTLPAPKTVKQQVEEAILASEYTANNGQYIKMVTLDNSNLISYRNVQASAGEVYLNNNTTQQALTVNTLQLIQHNGFILNNISRNFDMPNFGRLRYIGVDPVVARVTITLTCNSTVNNQLMRFYIGRNGITAVNSVIAQNIGNSSNVAQNITVQGIFTCNQNDYFELFVENTTAGNPVICTFVNIGATCFFM